MMDLHFIALKYLLSTLFFMTSIELFIAWVIAIFRRADLVDFIFPFILCFICSGIGFWILNL